jgi:hypothetical protein
MGVQEWLISGAGAATVPIALVLMVISGVLRERDVDAEGTADSGLGRLQLDESGRPVRWSTGLLVARRITVLLLAVTVAVLVVATATRFAFLA